MQWRSKRWGLGMVAVTLALSLGLAACGGAAAPAATGSAAATSSAAATKTTTKASSTPVAAKSGNVTVAVPSDAVCLLPYNTNDNLSFGIEADIYQGLIGYDHNMKLVGELADKWAASSDAKTFTFYLNPKAKFSDGSPVTAQAVKQSFEFLLNKKYHLVRTALYSPISKIKVVNSETVQFILDKPFGAMIPTFAHPAGAVINPKVLSKGVQYLCTHPEGGSGPFVFKNWVQGDHITVVKNNNYWDPATAAQVQSITYRPITDASSRVSGLETGQFQFAFPIPGPQIAALKSKSGISIHSAPGILVDYVSLNVLHAPFNNVKVRQALNYAINRSALIKVVEYGYAANIDSPLAKGDQYYARVGTYQYDPTKAKKLLAEANYPNGFTANLWLGNTTTDITLGTAIQQQLAQVGVKVKVQPMDTASLSSEIWHNNSKTSKMQMYLTGWSPSTGDADWGLRPLLATSSWSPSIFNTGFFSDPKVDADIQGGLNTASSTARAAAYKDAQTRIWNDAPWIFLFVPDNVWGERSNVQGAYVRADEVVLVRHISVH